jgi:hypothetical protein
VQNSVGSDATGASATQVVDGMVGVAVFSLLVAIVCGVFAWLYRDRATTVTPPTTSRG